MTIPAGFPYEDGTVISYVGLQVTIAIFFASSILSVIIRTCIKIHLRQASLDDAFFAVGTACLIGSTVLVYKSCDNIFIGNVLQNNPSLAFKLPPDVLIDVLATLMPWLSAFIVLEWTAIFCVKAIFLIVCKQLINRLNIIWLRRYFWFITVFTAFCWIISISSTFMSCPYKGEETFKCSLPGQDTRYLSIAISLNISDILTDTMIALIPIFVLRKSQLQLRQKLVLGSFLCLSLIMTVFAIMRLSKLHNNGMRADMVWSTFWQYIEASIAITVSSILTFRALSTNRKQKQSLSSRRLLKSHGVVEVVDDQPLLNVEHPRKIPLAAVRDAEKNLQDAYRMGTSGVI